MAHSRMLQVMILDKYKKYTICQKNISSTIYRYTCTENPAQMYCTVAYGGQACASYIVLLYRKQIIFKHFTLKKKNRVKLAIKRSSKKNE